MINIAIFASGSGTNAENLMRVFHSGNEIRIKKIYTNNTDAGVIKRAQAFNVPCAIYSNAQFKSADEIISDLQSEGVQYIILAGFLRLITTPFLEAFPNKIINIHPSLLPNYGGKGMYGMRVHEEVIRNRESQSGITIHLVNHHYDEGATLAQYTCEVKSDDTPEMLASRIHELEYQYFPRVIHDFLIQKEQF